VINKKKTAQQLSDELAIHMPKVDYETLLEEKVKELERQLEQSEKERWKTAENLHKCRKKLKEIKEIIK